MEETLDRTKQLERCRDRMFLHNKKHIWSLLCNLYSCGFSLYALWSTTNISKVLVIFWRKKSYKTVSLIPVFLIVCIMISCLCLKSYKTSNLEYMSNILCIKYFSSVTIPSALCRTPMSKVMLKVVILMKMFTSEESDLRWLLHEEPVFWMALQNEWIPENRLPLKSHKCHWYLFWTI